MKTIKYYHKNSDVIAYQKETYGSGSWSERTYDENGNILTFKDSDGYCNERTYDENGKLLTFKNSKGKYEIKGKEVTKEEFEAFVNIPENSLFKEFTELKELLKEIKELINIETNDKSK